jgi:ankyrin repeat protein
LAIRAGHLPVVQYLLQVCNVLEQYTGSHPPFVFACRFGHLDIVQWWKQEYQPDLNLSTHRDGKTGGTGLHLACTHGHVAVVQYLCEVFPKLSLPEIPDKNGNSPLHLACAANGDHTDNDKYQEVIEYLIRNVQVNVHARNLQGYTPFHVACLRGKLLIVRLLLETGHLTGLDIHQRTKDQQTAIDLVTTAGQSASLYDMQEFLLANGAQRSPNTDSGRELVHVPTSKSLSGVSSHTSTNSGVTMVTTNKRPTATESPPVVLDTNDSFKACASVASKPEISSPSYLMKRLQAIEQELDVTLDNDKTLAELTGPITDRIVALESWMGHVDRLECLVSRVEALEVSIFGTTVTGGSDGSTKPTLSERLAKLEAAVGHLRSVVPSK